MFKQTTATSDATVYPAELRDLLLRAEQGDESVLPDLRKGLDEHPDLVTHLGNLVQAAQNAILQWATGSCLATRELYTRAAADLRERLTATAHSELEKLLVDRIVICWLEVYTADIRFADHTKLDAEGTPVVQAVQKILDRAHRRYLTAIRCLATVQRLVRPSPAPVEIATRLRSPASRKGVRLESPVNEGIGITN